MNLYYSKDFRNYITCNPINVVQTIYRKPALFTSGSQRSSRDKGQRVTWNTEVEVHEANNLHYNEKDKKKVPRRSKEPSFNDGLVFRPSSSSNNLSAPLLGGTDDIDGRDNTTGKGILVETGNGIN